MKHFIHRVVLAGCTAKAVLAAGMPQEDIVRVAKLGNGTLEVARLEQPILLEGMKALFADLSAAGLGTAPEWLEDEGPVDLQNLHIDRSYGEPQTAEDEFLAAVRGDASGLPAGVGISKPDLWESAAIKETLGVDESKMSHPKPPPPSGGKPGKPKPGGGKPPIDPHDPGPGTEIPEPSTWALWLGGGALLAARRRRS